MGECDKSNAVEQLFYVGFGFVDNGNNGTEKRVVDIIKNLGISDIEQDLPEFEKMQRTFITLAENGNEKSIIQCLESEFGITTEWQQDTIVAALVKAYKTSQEAPKGMFV